MAIIIPTPQGSPFTTQITTIDGTDYKLSFSFNFRELAWYMGMALTDGTVLASGIKLVSNYFLLQKYADDRLPPGELVAVAMGADDSQAGINDLGGRVQLLYLFKNELTSAVDTKRL